MTSNDLSNPLPNTIHREFFLLAFPDGREGVSFSAARTSGLLRKLVDDVDDSRLANAVDSRAGIQRSHMMMWARAQACLQAQDPPREDLCALSSRQGI